MFATSFPDVDNQHVSSSQVVSGPSASQASSAAYVSPIDRINQEIRRKNVAAAQAASGPHNLLSEVDSSSYYSDPWDPSSVILSSGDVGVSANNFCTCGLSSAVAAPSSPSLAPMASPSSMKQSGGGMVSEKCPFCGKKLATITFTFSGASPVRQRRRSSVRDPQPSSPDNRSRTTRGNRIPSLSLPGAVPVSGNTPVSSSSPKAGTGEYIVSSVMDLEPRHAQALLQTTPQLRLLSPASTDMQGGAGNHQGLIQSPRDLIQLVVNVTTGDNGSTGPGDVSTSSKQDNSSANAARSLLDYQMSLVRDRANAQAASELASLLWVLAHEMSLEEFGIVESEVFSAVFGLVHDSESKERRMAGLAAVDALLAAPSADEEKKAIKFANTLSNGLRATHGGAGGDYEFLSSVSKALGHMATRTANVDFVESEVTRALEWLRTGRSDRRLAACLTLKEFAIHAPTTFHSKTSQSTLGQGGSNEFLDHIFQAIRDPQPIVRVCAADALSQCLKILVERRHSSLTGLLCQVHFAVMEGLQIDASRKRQWQAIIEAESIQHGSLLAVSTMLAYARSFMLPRFEEVCRAVLRFTTHSKALIRLEVIRLIPLLARRSPHVFGRRYLEDALEFLIQSASSPTPPRVRIDLRPSAYTSIGQLILAMTDPSTGAVIGGSDLPTIKIVDDPDGHLVEMRPTGIIYERLGDIFDLVRKGLASSGSSSSSRPSPSTRLSPALYCAAHLVEGLGDLALPYMSDLINEMFRAGLSNDLIRCLHSIVQCVPTQKSEIEERILQEVSFCLAGMRDVYDPLASFRASALQARANENVLSHRHGALGRSSLLFTNSSPGVRINRSEDTATVRSLVLSLQTLTSFGGLTGRVASSGVMIPLLPFVQDVTAKYLSHPSSEVRRAAALTCCALLIPRETEGFRITGFSGVIVEVVLERLMTVAVADPSAIVRLCVVRALDSRYDSYLCQSHHLEELFLLLQDEAVATRATGLQLLGRLAAINPAPILPVLRRFLSGLIVELQTGVGSGRGREDATRLLVVLLRAKPLRRLILPVLASLIEALPLDRSAPPRLASASLEALGDLAEATGEALRPWLGTIVPHVLDILRDQSSASKQRTSLRTLGQIAGSTGYVIQPYLEYPKLLTQATDILPATKRAPWSLRREVIRTLGILGALDPDRYHAFASLRRKGGAVGGAYFEELDLNINTKDGGDSSLKGGPTQQTQSTAASGALPKKRHFSESNSDSIKDDDELPAYLFMYEQYAMVAQPVSTLPPAKRLSPIDEDFYPTVAIQALMRIFRDQSLAAHHGMVIQAIMFIFKSLGVGCVPYLRRVVPPMIQAVRTCSNATLREALLKQLAILSLIAREHLRPYISDVLDVVEQFWGSRHLATILSLISKIAVGVPDEFRRFVPRLVRRLLATLEELQVADWSAVSFRIDPDGIGRGETGKLALILKSVNNLKGVLGDYLHVLVPAFLKLGDALASLDLEQSSNVTDELASMVFHTVSELLESQRSRATSLSLVYFSSDKFTSLRSSENWLPSRVIQPLTRILREKRPRSPVAGIALIETLCICARLIGGSKWSQLYDAMVREAIRDWQASFPIVSGNDLPRSSSRVDERFGTGLQLYEDAIDELLNPPKRTRTPSISRIGSSASQWVDSSILATNFDVPDSLDNTISSSTHGQSVHRVNQSSLQRAWDVTQRASREDWDEWMRRFAIQLLREAPSASLRATASLAHAYQPLARELFSAAFACCWNDLSEPYRVNLVHALETAFVADVSPEILQALLNLAEFMEHDPRGGLPIGIPILADLALKCRAYAKSLHYREREYNMGGSTKCVESLISINRKLDLPEAALGVLKASSIGDIVSGKELPQRFSKQQANELLYGVTFSTDDIPFSSSSRIDLMEKQELWLAKLGSWTEALVVYQNKLAHDPQDFEALLGCMRCLDASGEWKKVLQLFENNLSTMSAPSSGNVLQLRDDIAPRSKRKSIRLCAHAAWRLGQWDDLEKFSNELVRGPTDSGARSSVSSSAPSSIDNLIQKTDFDGAFYRAVLHVHRKEWHEAEEAIDSARRAMDGRLTALMAESYSRAYPSMVTAQTLAEMEEIIEYRKVEECSVLSAHQHPANRPSEEAARKKLICTWRERLAGCRVDADVHASILAVRSLVLGPDEEVDATLKLSKLSRQTQRYKFAESVLLRPLRQLNADLNGAIFGFGLDAPGPRIDWTSADSSILIDKIFNADASVVIPSYGPTHNQWSRKLVSEAGGAERLIIQHKLYLAYVKHLMFTDPERRQEALARLDNLCRVVEMVSQCEGVPDNALRVACWLELGDWKLSEATGPNSMIGDRLQLEVLTAYKRATLLEDCGYRAWHAWALLNFRIAVQMEDGSDSNPTSHRSVSAEKVQRNHVTAAVQGFVNAISLGTKKQSASVQQDLLNLTTCLFKYGNLMDIAKVINENIVSVALEAWLGVLPQLLARIHIKDPSIRAVLHPLLVRLGEKHPQALMYPLSVLLKSPVAERKNSAESLMNSLKEHSSDLVGEALMVSSELIRVAILWLETWHEGLEDASRLYFVEGNVSGMLDILLPLHEKVEAGTETLLESDFLKNYGPDLAQAHLHIREYMRLVAETGANIPTGANASQSRHSIQSEEAEAAINRAWDIYYTFFRRVNKQLPSLTTLELSQCSPALSRARSLELGVPGSYRVDGTYIKIEKFISNINVITSKQRPRKITLRGNDGKDYLFLLKGHEDLRQDERVMQLFGLVNALLGRDPQTMKHDLRIQRYAICPLSHNCGVVGWVPHCDTLHSLIRDYRQSKKIPLNMENREMLKIAPDYDLLTGMQKVEVFTEALRKTTGRGNDLYEILWLKSTNSEEWLDRRTKYTRSLAVMSIVGYILGLGDRHPSNLMIDKLSGRVLHIDFGDCFEVAMNRDKYPEKVPFRLTRMLIKAMEVSGIEGSYRSTCERTMAVLRASRDSLVAMLEAFVYDPLISWRLADLSAGDLSNGGDGDQAFRPHRAPLSGMDSADSGVPIEFSDRSSIMEGAISEDHNEEDDQAHDLPSGMDLTPHGKRGLSSTAGHALGPHNRGSSSASRARSLQMYTNIQSMAANLSTESRIASITTGNNAKVSNGTEQQVSAEGSLARSRMERSMRQRNIMSLLEGDAGAAHEEALNEKALKVIRRVQDKLAGTDFGGEGEQADVTDQVQRLIVQATSSENLCQLFVGWCAFW